MQCYVYVTFFVVAEIGYLDLVAGAVFFQGVEQMVVGGDFMIVDLDYDIA